MRAKLFGLVALLSLMGPGQAQAPASNRAELAAKFGLNSSEAAGQLSNILPGLIDKRTPHGEAPSAALGNSSDLMGMLGGLLRKS